MLRLYPARSPISAAVVRSKPFSAISSIATVSMRDEDSAERSWLVRFF
jgi:hypothetical protein